MERLLASKLSQGPLIEQKDALGNAAFVPVANATPMPRPKPPDLSGAKSMASSKSAGIGSGAAGGVHQTTAGRGFRAAEKHQSITWADMARSWMGDDASDVSTK